MTQVFRQSELFAGEDWTILYKAFTEVNFNAYDFDTIRSSMIEYIRFNFPEDFNDWIESSEFVAIIDLLAYLGQTLAFRMDLNTRENFIDDAERRDSVLKLARLLSYVPNRNISAEGLVKIIGVTTDEPILDSLGQNLQNAFIEWDDANNPDWFEQWILIFNSAFVQNNPFGKPVKSGTISSIPTQLYQIDTNPVSTGSYSYTTTIKTTNIPFEVVNVDFNDGERFFEQDPDILYSFHLLYRNDGLGNTSPNSGFFLYFKQGSTSFEDFTLTYPLENRVLDINVPNINNEDVWVQTVNDNGTTLTNWTKVPAIFGNNVIFNSLKENQRNIFSVITRDNDQISIRFADGIFGEVPTGIIRVYFRTSANASYTIKTSDMLRKDIAIPYFNATGDPYTLTVSFRLEEAVANSAARETIDQIKERAPRVYYTQNRMVNGEDYNIYPLQNSNILKLKAINRVYSGHSRFIDINDPTATFQDVNVFADDGAVYEEFDDSYVEIPLSANKSSGEIVSTILYDLMKNPEMQQFFYKEYPKQIETFYIPNPILPSGSNYDVPPFIVWEQASSESFSSTGQFGSNTNATPPTTADLGNTFTGTPISVGQEVPAIVTADIIREGALVEFNFAGWVKVQNILSDGQGFQATGQGNITLAEPVLTNDWIRKVYPSFRTDLVTSEITEIKNEIDDQNTFGIRFNYTTQEWTVIKFANLAIDAPFSLQYSGDTSLTNKDASWLIQFEFKTDRWQITSRGLRYVYESEKDVRFFVNQFFKVSGVTTNRASRDTITVFGTNSKPSAEQPLGNDLSFRNLDIFTYEDGHSEPRRVLVTYNDSDDDGVPDDPDIFNKIVLETVTKPTGSGCTTTNAAVPEPETYVFHRRFTDQYGYEQYELDATVVAVPDILLGNASSLTYTDQDGNIINVAPLIQTGTVVFRINDATMGGNEKTFLIYNPDELTPPPDKTNISNYEEITDARAYQYHTGRQHLKFLWKHFATKDQRIDPAITNIIDALVLTTGYNNEYRLWVQSNDSTADEPDYPSSEQLDITFSELDDNKMVSDEIIWRSAKYKPLFGEQAAEEVRAKIKVVKIPNAKVNDNELKSRVISTIDAYFDISLWDFGDTFFASELAAYVHQQLPTLVAGFEIVPLNEEAKFGNLQQIKAESDEIFISTAKVSDVEVVPVFTETVLRVGK